MMDYYSNFAGPTKEQAIEIMRQKYKNVNNIVNYATIFVEEEIKQYGSLGSYTGWCVHTQKTIEQKIIKIYNSQKAIQKVKNKFKIICIFIGFMKTKKTKN